MNEKANGTVFLEWKRSGGEVARLVEQEYNGKHLVHLRVFYLDQHRKLKPSPRGVTIPYDQLAAFRKALRKAEKALAVDAMPEDKTKKEKKWPPT